jgi:hypothetical protein
MGASGTIGERFARAVAIRDAPALLEVLAPDVSFQGMTPSRIWATDSAETLVRDVLLGSWFTPGDVVEAIESLDHGTVADRGRVGYRFRVTNDRGTFLVEQQAYFDAQDERITWLRIMCSGYRRWSG